jgi:hypothetical protein
MTAHVSMAQGTVSLVPRAKPGTARIYYLPERGV